MLAGNAAAYSAKLIAFLSMADLKPYSLVSETLASKRAVPFRPQY